MKKEVKILDIDCANCAKKLEIALSEIEGVNMVNINFLFEKMTIDINDDIYDEVIVKVKKVIKKKEPESRVIGL